MASLGNDLAKIRKKRNLTLEDVQQATKIPKRILHSIEDDSIFSDFEENPTYIRSYIRGYAKAVSIDDKQIIRALDKWEIGAYDGLLLKLEGIKPSDEEKKTEEDEKQEEHSSSGEDEEIDEDDDMIHDHSPAFQFEGDNDSESASVSSSASLSSSERADVHDVNWAQMGKEFSSLESSRSRVGIAIIIVLLVGLGGFFFFYFNSESEQIAESQNNNTNQEQEAEAALSTDSLELNVTPSPADDTTDQTPAEDVDTSSSIQSEMFEVLPDTLDMIVYAAYGRLEPVRVYTDIIGDINPYWIEEGEAVQFDFVNEIRIRGQLDDIVLIMNGHVVEDFEEEFYNPDTRLIEINRSYFEEDSKWLQPAPDSLDIDAPSPSIIRERPTF